MTAEEFLEDFQDLPRHIDEFETSDIAKVMREFAKLHVEAQQKAIIENINLEDIINDDDYSSILNAYPLENIK